MKALVLLLAMTAGSAAHGAALMPAELAEDALMKQILAKQLTQDNGGVTAAVLVRGSSTGITLDVTDALKPLAPAEGLAGKPAPKAKKKPARRADAQLAGLDAEGAKASWDKPAK